MLSQFLKLKCSKTWSEVVASYLGTNHPFKCQFDQIGFNYTFGPCRYLYHSSSNPDAAFQSAKILRRIANHPNIQSRLVGDFTHDQVLKPDD